MEDRKRRTVKQLTIICRGLPVVCPDVQLEDTEAEQQKHSEFCGSLFYIRYSLLKG